MVGFVRIFLGAFILITSLFLRFYIFTTEILTSFGMSVNEAYALIEKMALFDPIFYIVMIGGSMLLVVWGATM